MNILLVLDQFDGATNGNTNSARRLMNELTQIGHCVRVAAQGESREDKYGFPIYHLPLFDPLVRQQGFVFAKRDAEKMAQAVAWADIVHVMMPFALGRSAALEAKKQGKPCTGAFHIQPENIWYSVHLGTCMPVINLTYAAFREYMFKHVHYIHCPSNMIKLQLEKHHYKGECRVISNGIESDVRYHKCPKDPAYEKKILIVMCGRYSGEKRQDVLIDAVKKSKYKNDIVLYLAGQGPLKTAYEKQCADLPNKAVMKFLSKAELMRLFGQADLYVHASDAEIEALSCMEAFASGLVPIIANSERSATPQFALDDRSLFTPGSSTELAQKIDWWIEHPEERKRMEHVYAAEADKYRLHDCTLQMVQMFQDEIKRNAAAS
ncbi:MAG TPA: glycosyltransferase [Candidatus Treponema faecavium]|nr:glycosyltransferase [Candidatus Treponema faecavium]